MNSNMILNRLFTQYNFDDLIQGQKNDVYISVIKRFVQDPLSKNNGEIIARFIRICLKIIEMNIFIKIHCLINYYWGDIV